MSICAIEEPVMGREITIAVNEFHCFFVFFRKYDVSLNVFLLLLLKSTGRPDQKKNIN